MTSAVSALLTAAIERLRAKPTSEALAGLGVVLPEGVTVQPGPRQPLPYIIAQSPTEAFSDASTSAEGSDNTLEFMAWARSHGQALRIAEAVQAALTDRGAPLALPGFNVLSTTAELLGPPYSEPGTAEGEAPAWGCPARVRIRIYRES